MSSLENSPVSPSYVPTLHLWVDAENWEHAEKVLTYDDLFRVKTDPIRLIKVGARWYLIDGHHRLVNAVMKELTLMTATVDYNVPRWSDLPVGLQGYVHDIEFMQCPFDSIIIQVKENTNETTNLLVSYDI